MGLWRNRNRCKSSSDVALVGKTREDAAERLHKAHEAAAHDKWFREQIEAAVAEADSPAAEWITNEEANVIWTKKRAELLERVEI